MSEETKPQSVEKLEGFEDAGALLKKRLLKTDDIDYSGTSVSYTEEADGSYRVEWKVDDAPTVDFLKRTFPFIGAGILVLVAILNLYFFWPLPGPILLAIALIAWAVYCVVAALKNKEEKYVFLIGIDNFAIVHDRVFHSEVIISYDNIKGVELLSTGTEETWGQTMAVTEKMQRHQISGKKESIELLCKTVETFLYTVRARRKKMGKDEGMKLL
ncbi:MAG: hypothetical protein A2008_11070 [Candidatus Wallbacteria bacterium GWC2_49_35]|uniref:Uncharacterized protein n=1 Tax=Candidatus Wallbacteria bacterium GWC2_49_35 TaxID=1817813 RepID=A0A1F7WJF5_9BACT|nr:MAG: hypothetical protein A2008_11070 [Candidatus Wallbacteria bacterium GWC2_49_35]HBC76707.1 hypothetical protein [Candidatus Wallbacteria bacterium]